MSSTCEIYRLLLHQNFVTFKRWARQLNIFPCFCYVLFFLFIFLKFSCGSIVTYHKSFAKFIILSFCSLLFIQSQPKCHLPILIRHVGELFMS